MALFPLSGLILTDNNNVGVAGGKLEFYEAGTTTPLDVHTDVDYTTPASNPVVLDSAGRCPTTYWQPDSYKVVFKSADEATTYWTIDDWVVEDPATASAVSSVTVTSNTSVASGDLDRLFYGNTASGDVTITADSATLGSGFLFHAKKSSSDANSLIISGTGGQVIDGNATFSLDAQYDSATFISLGAAGWAVLAQTIDTATLVSDNAKQRIQVALHCGRFEYSSATVCKLVPYNGTYVNFPNGDLISIPAAGVSTTYNNAVINGTAAQTLSTSTLYYAYVYNDSGTLVIDWSTTAPAWDSTTGIRIKTGDDTRVLVGCAYTNGSSQFDDSASKRNVASWRNRRPRTLYNAFSTNRTTTSGSYTEINSEIRCEFVSWGDVMRASYAGGVTSSSANAWFSGVSLDGGGSGASIAAVQVAAGTNIANASVTGAFTPSVGHHYVTVMGATAGGATGTWSSASEQGKLFGEVVI